MNAFVVYGVKYFANTARFFVGPPKKKHTAEPVKQTSVKKNKIKFSLWLEFADCGYSRLPKFSKN